MFSNICGEFKIKKSQTVFSFEIKSFSTFEKIYRLGLPEKFIVVKADCRLLYHIWDCICLYALLRYAVLVYTLKTSFDLIFAIPNFNLKKRKEKCKKWKQKQKSKRKKKAKLVIMKHHLKLKIWIEVK